MRVNEETKKKIVEAGKMIWDNDKVREKFSNDMGQFDAGKFSGVASKSIQVIKDAVEDVKTGRYTFEPYWKWYMMVGAAIYAISPIDLLPDFIPGIGLIDDAAILATVAGVCISEINKYVTWKYSEDSNIDDFIVEPDEVAKEDIEFGSEFDGEVIEVTATEVPSDLDDAFEKLKNV